MAPRSFQCYLIRAPTGVLGQGLLKPPPHQRMPRHIMSNSRHLSVTTVLKGVDQVQHLHCDIQGEEAEALVAAAKTSMKKSGVSLSERMVGQLKNVYSSYLQLLVGDLSMRSLAHSFKLVRA